jgi:hypothetical protein
MALLDIKWGNAPDTLRRSLSAIFRLAAKPNQSAIAKSANRVERPSQKLRRYNSYRIEMDMDNLRRAVLTAESPLTPSRHLLINLYNQAMTTDAHLIAVARQRIAITNGEPFFLCKDNKEVDVEATKLLMRPWFRAFTKHWIEHILFGHSVVEFGELVNGEFTEVMVIPREFVIPELKMIVPQIGLRNGIVWTEPPFSDWLLPIGEPNELGLLLPATRQVIFKRFSESDWARRTERFGSPILVIRTDVTSPAELDKKEEMAANLGSNGWAILDNQDMIELKEPSNAGDPSKIYSERIKLTNEEISKLILGQTMTTDNGSSKAQGEVHERVMYEQIEGDMRAFQDYVNYNLIPFLIRHGYPLEGYTFVFKRFYNLFKDPAKMDDPMEDSSKQKGKVGSKKDSKQDDQEDQESLAARMGFF